MRRLLVPLLLLLALPAVADEAPPLELLLAGHFRARGGLERLRALSTLRASGKRIDGEHETRFVWEWKRPGKIRYEVESAAGPVIQGWDRHTGWMMLPGAERPRILDAEVVSRFDQEADFDGPLLDAEAKGNQLRMLEPASVDGTDCWVIGVVLPTGDVQQVYLEKKSLLEMRRVTRVIRDTGDLEIIVNYGGYMNVGGLRIAHRQRTRARGREGETIMFFERIEPDVPLDDSLFSPPPPKSP